MRSNHFSAALAVAGLVLGAAVVQPAFATPVEGVQIDAAAASSDLLVIAKHGRDDRQKDDRGGRRKGGKGRGGRDDGPGHT